MSLRPRSGKQEECVRYPRDGAISLATGRGIVVSSAPMKKFGFAALALVALSLPGLSASAQTESGEEQQPEEKAKASAEPAEPAEPAATTKAAPEPEPAGPYVPLAPPPEPLRISNASASIQLGMLLQPQFEMTGSSEAELTTKNLFLRRTRLIVAGTLFKYFEYFFDTDWPNLFKLDIVDTMGGTVKNAPGMNIQDAFVTAKPAGDLIAVDAGFMLPPLSHNNIESAAKLYGPDYFTNGFRRNVSFMNAYDPFRSNGQNSVGRDLGVQLRGLVVGGHVEYRVGLFQGFRISEVTGPPARVGGLNFFRVSARLQVNILDAEPGFFHAGTYHGAKKILSVGGFYDFQDKYKYFGGDLLVDLPTGSFGVFTLQANVVRWDGGTFISEIRKNAAYMVEGGYLIGAIRLSPIVRYERVDAPEVPTDPSTPGSPLIPDTLNPSENRIGGGLAFWPFGHNTNFKAFFQRVHRVPGTNDYNQVNVQWQLYFL